MENIINQKTALFNCTCLLKEGRVANKKIRGHSGNEKENEKKCVEKKRKLNQKAVHFTHTS